MNKKLKIALIIIAVIVAAVAIFMLVNKQNSAANDTISDSDLASIYADIESITNESAGANTANTEDVITPISADDFEVD